MFNVVEDDWGDGLYVGCDIRIIKKEPNELSEFEKSITGIPFCNSSRGTISKITRYEYVYEGFDSWFFSMPEKNTGYRLVEIEIEEDGDAIYRSNWFLFEPIDRDVNVELDEFLKLFN